MTMTSKKIQSKRNKKRRLIYKVMSSRVMQMKENLKCIYHRRKLTKKDSKISQTAKMT
jgi:hypothetical protein